MTSAPPSDTESRALMKSASAMGAATFLSRILGLIREQTFAFFFGAGFAMDAFNVAFRIPNLLRDLFAEGAMSASLVPTFTQARKEEGDLRAWRVCGLVFRILFLIVTALTLLGIFFTPELVSLYAEAFKAHPEKYELTVKMTRILFPFFPMVALAAAFMGVLNACGVFFIPAFSSALFNLFSIGVGVLCSLILFEKGSDWKMHPIEGMTLGVLAGGLIQALSQLPSLYRVGYRWVAKTTSTSFPVWHQDPYLRKMLWMMIPGTVGLAATQVNILVNTILASSQGTGAVSWLNYSFRLMQFPIGIFGVSLAAATLPRISRQWVDQDFNKIEATLHQSLRQVFAINLPASAGLAFLGIPIIELIFQYGKFRPEDTQATALALAMYAIGLTAYSAVKVLVPACYGLGKTRVAVQSSVISVLLTIVLNLITVKHFGYWGLALGTSVAAFFNFGYLLAALQKALRVAGGSLSLKPLFISFIQNLFIALLMGFLCYFSYHGLLHWIPNPSGENLLSKTAILGIRCVRTFLLIIEGLLIVLLLGKLFKVEEINQTVHDWGDLFRSKLRNRLK